MSGGRGHLCACPRSFLSVASHTNALRFYPYLFLFVLCPSVCSRGGKGGGGTQRAAFYLKLYENDEVNDVTVCGGGGVKTTPQTVLYTCAAWILRQRRAKKGVCVLN